VFIIGVAFATVIIYAFSTEFAKHQPLINQSVAKQMLNKTIITGITYMNEEDELVERKQFFGTIVRINEKEGVVIKLANSSEEISVPPQLDNIEKAKPGEYRLKSTGEVIVDPDYLITLTSVAGK